MSGDVALVTFYTKGSPTVSDEGRLTSTLTPNTYRGAVGPPKASERIAAAAHDQVIDVVVHIPTVRGVDEASFAPGTEFVVADERYQIVTWQRFRWSSRVAGRIFAGTDR